MNQANENIGQAQLNTWHDLVQRGFIAFFGLVLLAGAVYYFSHASVAKQGSPAYA